MDEITLTLTEESTKEMLKMLEKLDAEANARLFTHGNRFQLICGEKRIEYVAQTKARWLTNGLTLAIPWCSNCGGDAFGLHRWDAVLTDFCPHCGADMREEDAGEQ